MSAPVAGVKSFSDSVLGVWSWNVLALLSVWIKWGTFCTCLFYLKVTPWWLPLNYIYRGWCSVFWGLEMITSSWRESMCHLSTLSVSNYKGRLSIWFCYFPRHIKHEDEYLLLEIMITTFYFINQFLKTQKWFELLEIPSRFQIAL